MSFDLQEDRDLNVILVRWHGRFAVSEVRRFFAEIERRELYHACAPTLHDARSWDLNVPTTEMHSLARDGMTPPRTGRPRRSASVVGSELAYGMLRVLTGLREQPLLELEVFRDIETAKAWIGLGHLPGDPFDRLDRS